MSDPRGDARSRGAARRAVGLHVLSPRESAAQLARANKFMAEGNSCAETTWYRWSPDWVGAATNWERAATSFRTAQAYEQAMSAFVKVAGAQRHQKMNTYAIGRTLEQAGMAALQAGLSGQAAEHFGKAADCYVESGKNMKAATLLTKAAKELESVSLEDAYTMLQSACEVYAIEGKEHHSLDSFRTAITLLLRLRRLDEAVERMDSFAEILERNKQPSSLIRNGVSTVLIRLHQDRFEAAEAACQRYLKIPGFLRSPDARAIMRLLDAIQNESEEQFQAALKDQSFQFLEQEVGKILTEIGSRGAKDFHAPSPVKPVRIDDLLSPKEVSAPVGCTFGEESDSDSDHDTSHHDANDKHYPDAVPSAASSGFSRADILGGKELPEDPPTSAKAICPAPAPARNILEDTSFL